MAPDNPALHHEISQRLFEEAEILDEGRFTDWLAMMTEDVRYRVPVRVTRERGHEHDAGPEMDLFADDLETLRLRVARLHTDFAWAEDPPSRTRHVVSNVRVRTTPNPGEVEVRSYLLLYRNRGDEAAADLISGERHDVWRRTDAGWKLAARRVVIDQATLGTKNLAIFL